jgi:hypothetical protein
MTSLNSEWRKATRSNGSDSCVEARIHDGAVQVRDTKDRTGAVLTFTFKEWEAFLGGVGDGEFSLPS